MPQGVVKRAFKYRFFPTVEQTELLSRTFGCVRKVYNLALAERDRVWRVEQRRLTYGDTSALLTQWKRTTWCGTARSRERSPTRPGQSCVPCWSTSASGTDVCWS
ncbi:helix-turn-helix domain-containing protein [Streptomyces sp. NPDC058740]|uniref:helix-turn-helix domain-containing protein n=1 Tax=Streptomyces sp. NPDC058740 TaxID=3346619 RepID=UPI0036A3924D